LLASTYASRVEQTPAVAFQFNTSQVLVVSESAPASAKYLVVIAFTVDAAEKIRNSMAINTITDRLVMGFTLFKTKRWLIILYPG
jgi:hypothetical protein